mgnify:CR=1 FL=1
MSPTPLRPFARSRVWAPTATEAAAFDRAAIERQGVPQAALMAQRAIDDLLEHWAGFGGRVLCTRIVGLYGLPYAVIAAGTAGSGEIRRDFPCAAFVSLDFLCHLQIPIQQILRPRPDVIRPGSYVIKATS